MTKDNKGIVDVRTYKQRLQRLIENDTDLHNRLDYLQLALALMTTEQLEEFAKYKGIDEKEWR